MRHNPVCEHWTEIDYGGDSDDGDTSQSMEYCRAIVSGKVYGQCSCSGLKEECNNGMYIPQIYDDPREDR